VRLIIQVQTVVNQLIEIDLRWAFHAPVAASVARPAGAIATTIAGTAASLAASIPASLAGGTWRPIAAISVALLCCLLFSHVYPIFLDVTCRVFSTQNKRGW